MSVVYSCLVIRAVIMLVYFNIDVSMQLKDILLMVACFLQLSADVYVMVRFLLALKFFVKKKSEIEGGVLTAYNKRVVITILTFFVF